MAKKNPNNDLVTKGFLKSYLSEGLDKFREEIDQKLTDFRDKILNAVDGVMKEIVAMRQEQTLHFYKHEQIDEKLENHEERIKNIETHKFA